MIRETHCTGRLPRHVLRLVDAYGVGDTEARLGPLPSTNHVVEILRRIFEILYPRVYGRTHRTREGIVERLCGLLEEVTVSLADQIHRAARCSCPVPEPCAHCTDLSQDAAGAFLDSLPEIRLELDRDAQAAYDGDPAATGTAEILLAYPGFEAVTTYRVAHRLHRLDVPLLPRIMTEHAHRRTGIDIHPGARIGESFFIDHGTGAVIGETTVIGNNVKLYQGVTLGALSFPKDERGLLVRGHKRHPTLEDDVIVYAGATILGGDTVIGQGSVIGGNTWVTRSVPPYSKVVCAPQEQRIETAAPALVQTG
jgi:serine O-acetyltransferase